MKTCSKCGISKDESEFHKNKRSKDGLKNDCAICYNKRALARYIAHPRQPRQPPDTKVCSRCGAEKPVCEFPLHYDNRKRKYYLRSYCRLCHNSTNTEYEQNHKEQRSIYGKIYFQTTKDSRRVKRKTTTKSWLINSPTGYALRLWSNLNRRCVNGVRPKKTTKKR